MFAKFYSVKYLFCSFFDAIALHFSAVALITVTLLLTYFKYPLTILIKQWLQNNYPCLFF